MTNQSNKTTLGPLQWGIILLTTATAVMHFVLIFPDVLFILNGLGYMGLLAALYLPLPQLVRFRPVTRWVLMGYAALTVLVWIFIGQRDMYAYINKIIELLLIGLLWLESRSS